MRYPIVLAGVISLFVVHFAAREAYGASRTCVRAEVAEAFVLPDGSWHSAGTLRICLDRDYSPVQGLHSITADGQGIGMFLSRRSRPEGAKGDSPQLAFVRDGMGSLVLRGYTLAKDGGVEAYWLEAPRGRRTASARAFVADAPTPTGETVWLAAVIP